MNELRSVRDLTMLGLGGQFQNWCNAFIGSATTNTISRLRADTLFLSMAAITDDMVFHQSAEMVETKRAMCDAAATRIKDVMAQAGKPVTGVRVGVKNGGCAGMEYTMEYAAAANPTDEVVEDKGVKILIDPKAVLFLLGTEMDFKTEKLSAQFVFNNPNQTGACGCGESVQLTPAKDAAE